MSRLGTLFSTAAILSAAFAALAADPAPPMAPPPRAVDVGVLVRQLSSPRFDERESATKRLGRLPLASPPPELLDALRSPNREVRTRAEKAVKEISARAEERALGRERTFAKRGSIDRFVASAPAWDVPANDNRLWQAVMDLAMDVSKRANRTWSPANGRPSINPKHFWRTAGKSALFIS